MKESRFNCCDRYNMTRRELAAHMADEHDVDIENYFIQEMFSPKNMPWIRYHRVCGVRYTEVVMETIKGVMIG